MADTRQILDDLHGIRRTGYGKALPGQHDHAFIELAQAYAVSSNREREEIRNYVPNDLRMLIIGFSGRLATLAARTGNRDFLFLSLIAHSIEDCKLDERENILKLAISNHVAKKLGEDSQGLFEKVAELSSPSCAKILRSFSGRPEKMKTLQVMNIEETETPGGVAYRPYE